MLLIDGVRYYEWIPQDEVKEFQPIIAEHVQDIFGEHAEYFEKHKLESELGKGSVPDGFVISFGDPPCWHVVEVELSSHDLHRHIVEQHSRFIIGIKNPRTRNRIVDRMYKEICDNGLLKSKVREAIKSDEIHGFLSDIIVQPPLLTIIIEKHKPELDDALSTLSLSDISDIKVVEFRTFTREGCGLAAHAHLFGPVAASAQKRRVEANKLNELEEKKPSKASKVSFEELVKAGLVAERQTLYFYHTRLFGDEQGQIIASSDKLKYVGDGELYSTSLLAKKLLIKHGFKHDEYGVRGPVYWKTSDGELLHEINERYRESISRR